jgi:hypothetical protein
MTKDNQINFRVNDPTNEAIEEFAEKHDFTKAESVRRMVEDRLAGEGYLSHRSHTVVTDGGELKKEIGELHSDLNELSNDFDSEIDDVATRTIRSQRIDGVTLLGILWIGVHVIMTLPTWVTGVTGIALVVLLILSMRRESLL